MGVGFLRRRRRHSAAGRRGSWPRMLPEGTGYLLPKGADVVIQVHYHRNGRRRRTARRSACTSPRSRSSSRIKAVGHRPAIRPVHSFIPAGDEQYHDHRAASWLPSDCTLHSVMPHMHLLGKEIKVTMTPPGGEPTDARGHQGLGLQLAGDVLLQGADSRSRRARVRRRGDLRQQRQEPEQPEQPAASWSASASRRPTRCASSSSADHAATGRGRSHWYLDGPRKSCCRAVVGENRPARKARIVTQCPQPRSVSDGLVDPSLDRLSGSDASPYSPELTWTTGIWLRLALADRRRPSGQGRQTPRPVRWSPTG